MATGARGGDERDVNLAEDCGGEESGGAEIEGSEVGGGLALAAYAVPVEGSRLRELAALGVVLEGPEHMKQWW